MNVAINFYSQDYARFVEDRIDSIFEDTEAVYDGSRFLQDISRDLGIRFYDYIIPNTITREDLLEDSDPVLVVLTKMIIYMECLYPGAHVIGFQPVDLKGRMLAVLQVPDNANIVIHDITHH